MADEIGARIKRFRVELEQDRDQYLRLGRWNYRAAYALAIVTVLSSAAAGILGLGFDVDKRLVAVVALIPAIAVTVASQFKWQEKANWHYRRHDAAKALLRRIDYELPLRPTEAQLAELSKGYSLTEAEMTETWEDLKLRVEAADEAEGEAAGGDWADGRDGTDRPDG